jgi:hypothetical protein
MMVAKWLDLVAILDCSEAIEFKILPQAVHMMVRL